MDELPIGHRMSKENLSLLSDLFIYGRPSNRVDRDAEPRLLDFRKTEFDRIDTAIGEWCRRTYDISISTFWERLSPAIWTAACCEPISERSRPGDSFGSRAIQSIDALLKSGRALEVVRDAISLPEQLEITLDSLVEIIRDSLRLTDVDSVPSHFFADAFLPRRSSTSTNGSSITRRLLTRDSGILSWSSLSNNDLPSRAMMAVSHSSFGSSLGSSTRGFFGTSRSSLGQRSDGIMEGEAVKKTVREMKEGTLEEIDWEPDELRYNHKSMNESNERNDPDCVGDSHEDSDEDYDPMEIDG